MKKLHIILAALIFFSSFMLSGCYPDGSVNLLLDEEFIDIDISERDIKNLTIDLKLPTDYPKEVCEIYPKTAEYDRSAFIDMFIREDDVIVDEGNEDDNIYKVTEDGRFAAAGNGNFFWYKYALIDFPPMHYGLLLSGCSFYYMRHYFPVADTAFPLSEARERAEAFLSDIGITNFGEPEVYYFSADEANNGVFADEDEPHEATRNDEAYILNYPIMLCDVPVMQCGKYMSDKIFHDPSRVAIIITKDEIIFAQSDVLYSPEPEKGEAAPIISPKEAFDIAIGNFSGSYIQYPTTLYDCKLVYMNIGEYESPKLVPVWEFDYYAEGDGYTDYWYTHQIIVDARTGRVY